MLQVNRVRRGTCVDETPPSVGSGRRTGNGGDPAVNAANFGPIATDAAVHGACRPGHLGASVSEWADVLRTADVSTVVCLLSDGEARRWGVPDAYADAFEAHHVPIRDRHLPSTETLSAVVDLLASATANDRRVAIHCNAGQGRTGVVAAAWLVRSRGLSPERAVEAVESAPVPRSPREAVRADNATMPALLDRLDGV